MAVDYKKYGMFGAAAGLFTAFVLKFISMLVSVIPGVTLDLQSVSVTGKVSGAFSTGLGTYAQKLLGLIPFVGITDWVYVAAGGAAFAILGAVIVDKAKTLQFAKTRVGKLATVMVIAGIISGWILSKTVTIPALSMIVVMAVDAYVLSWVFVAIDKKGYIVP